MRPSSWRARPWLSAAAVVAVASVLLAIWMYRTQIEAQRRLFETQAHMVQHEVEDGYIHLLAVVEATQGLYSASEEVTRQELITFFRSLDARAFGKTAALIVDHPDGTRSVVQRGDYLREQPRLDPAVIEQARVTGITLVGPPVTLEHAIRGPTPAYTLSRALRNDPVDRRTVITAVFFPQDVLESVAELHEGMLAVAILDVTEGRPVTIAQSGHPVAWLVERVTLPLPGRTWELVVTPGPSFPVGTGHAPLIVVAIGLALTAVMLRAESLERSRIRLRLVEERLGLAEELNRSKDDFLATVSHEIRTPLASIQGFVALLNEGEVPAEEQEEVLTIVLDQAEELANLVEDLLVDARASAGILTVNADRCPVGREAETVLRALPAGEVELDMGEDVVAMADPVRFRQILRNLIRNAALYGGGRIRIVAAREEQRVVVRVEDDGTALSDEEAEHLFARYVRGDGTYGTGVGIGLHLSRTLAEMMGGSLYHERRGPWTCFVLCLPAAPLPDRPVTSSLAGEASGAA